MASDNEQKYFLLQEVAARKAIQEKLHQQAEQAAAHRKEAHGQIDNEHLKQRVDDLGFSAETAAVLHLMPLIEVAWVDGGVSKEEREVIFDVADEQGIEPGSKSALLLASLLETQPDQQWLDETLLVLRDMLAAKNLPSDSIVTACRSVAQASGGFLGFGSKVEDSERNALSRLDAIFGDRVRKRLVDQAGQLD